MGQDLMLRSQLFWAMVTAMLPTGILLFSGLQLHAAGRFAWCTPLIVGVAMSGVAYLSGRSAGIRGDLIAAATGALGRGRALLLLPLWLVLAAAFVLVLQEYVELGVHIFVGGTPPPVLLLVMGLAPFLVLLRAKPAALGRTAVGIGIVVVLAYLAILALALGEVHLNWGLPLVPKDTRFLSEQSIGSVLGWVTPGLLGAFILSYVEPRARTRAGPTLAAAVLCVTFLQAVGLWVEFAYFGSGRAIGFIAPFIAVAREETFGTLLRNLGIVALPAEVMALTVKIAVIGLAWLRVAEGMVGGGQRRWLVPAMVAPFAIYALTSLRSDLDLDRTIAAVSPVVALLLMALMVATYLLAAWRSVRAAA